MCETLFPLKLHFFTHLTQQARCLGCILSALTPLSPSSTCSLQGPIECREAIEKLLQDMADQEIIAPVTEPMEWVSSLTYSQKPDGSLHICLDPRDLNKAIILEHYKVPTLDEITHKLSGAKVCSKLDMRDGFWSIHLNKQSSYLTTFNMHKDAIGSSACLLALNVTRCVPNADGPNN